MIRMRRSMRGLGADTVSTSMISTTQGRQVGLPAPNPGSAADVQLTPTQPTSVRQLDPCDASRSSCDAGWQKMLQALPGQAACLQYVPEYKWLYMDICCKVTAGQLSSTDGTAQWRDYMNKVCPPNAPPTPSPPAYAPPPPAPPSPHDNAPGGDTGGGPVTQPRSAVKTWGPIVGIGLIAAVGLTLARKRPKRRRATKR